MTTEMDILEKQFKEDVKRIKDECLCARNNVTGLLTSKEGYFVSPAGWEEVVKNQHTYNIAEIRLMSIDKRKDLGMFEQFMLKFQDNETIFVYVKMAEVE